MEKYRYELNFSEPVQQAISELAKKYHLTLSKEDFWNFEKADPEIVIFKAAKKIVAMEKGSTMKDISHLLKTDLKMHQKDADKLAHDIKNHIVMLVDIIVPENEIEEQEEENDTKYDKESFQEELLNKIKGNAPEPETEPEELPSPNLKTPEIIDVDKNAKTIEHEHVQEENIPIPNANKPAEKKPLTDQPTPLEEPLAKPVQTDKYKEPIE